MITHCSFIIIICWRSTISATVVGIRQHFADNNHSNYLAINNVTGHYENPTDAGFTGIQTSDRTTYAGYQSTVIKENVSYGQSSTTQSVDSLMSAIYHRFAFLQPDIDEIGIGAYGTFFTYEMANSALNDLCNGASFNGTGSYYFGGCADANFKIEKSQFDEANALLAFSNPNMTLWPYDSVRDMPPAFLEESPDPLPDRSVSGYPISVEFNEAHFDSTITVQTFALFDQPGTEVTNARRFLSPSDDVNGKFSNKQFALFPLQRLDWGKTYQVRFDYTVGNGTPHSRIWWFTTRGLPHPYYQVDGPTVASFDVEATFDGGDITSDAGVLLPQFPERA